MTPETRTRVFSLGNYPYGEGDRVVVFYSRDLGKIKAAAKGVRKSTSKLVVLTELLNESDVVLAKRPGADLYRLAHGSLLDSRPALKERLASISALQVLADVLRSCVPDAEPDEGLYALLTETLERIGLGRDHPEAALARFFLRFLERGGYPASLASCAACGRSDAQVGRLSAMRGGWVCSSCDPNPSEGVKLSGEALGILRRLQVEGRGSLPAASAPDCREAFRAVALYLRHTLEQDLPTVDYYLRVTSTGGG